MILQEIALQLENSTHPVAKALHKGEHFKVLAVGFKKGMLLKEHQAYLPTKLFVIKGKVIYVQGEMETTLSCMDEIEIPVNIVHAVTALEDSLCLLTQG